MTIKMNGTLTYNILPDREISFEPNTFRTLVDYLNSTGMEAHVVEGDFVYCKGISVVRIHGHEGKKGNLWLSCITESELIKTLERNAGVN